MSSPFLAPNRDLPQRQARPKGGGTTYYTVPGVSFTTTNNGTAPGSATDCYAGFYCASPIVIDQLAIEVTTLEAAKVVRIGFYAADTDWQPIGAPLADSGDMSVAATGVLTYTPGTPIYVSRGRYLSVLNTDSTTAVFRAFGSTAPHGLIRDILGASAFPLRFKIARAHAAFPTPGSAWTSVEQGSVPTTHNIVYRISAA